jgi:hypothetical protein
MKKAIVVWFLFGLMMGLAIGLIGKLMAVNTANADIWLAMEVAPPSAADCGGKDPAEILLKAVTGQEVSNLCTFRPTAPGKTLPVRFQPKPSGSQ